MASFRTPLLLVIVAVFLGAWRGRDSACHTYFAFACVALFWAFLLTLLLVMPWGQQVLRMSKEEVVPSRFPLRGTLLSMAGGIVTIGSSVGAFLGLLTLVRRLPVGWAFVFAAHYLTVVWVTGLRYWILLNGSIPIYE